MAHQLHVRQVTGHSTLRFVSGLRDDACVGRALGTFGRLTRYGAHLARYRIRNRSYTAPAMPVLRASLLASFLRLHRVHWRYGRFDFRRFRRHVGSHCGALSNQLLRVGWSRTRMLGINEFVGRPNVNDGNAAGSRQVNGETISELLAIHFDIPSETTTTT